MISNASLRLRIFLFFALIVVVASLGILGGLYVGYRRLGDPAALSSFIQAGVIAYAVLIAVTALVWLLFDENLARPLMALSGELRARAHAGVDAEIEAPQARYLGDLAPAVKAVASNLAEARGSQSAEVAKQTEALAQTTDLLESIIHDMPVAVIFCTGDDRVALYNAHAQKLLGRGGHLGLNRSLFECLCEAPMREALTQLRTVQTDLETDCPDAEERETFHLRLRPVAEGGYLVTLFDPDPDGGPLDCGAVPRAEFYDFGLMGARVDRSDDTPLSELCYVVFDSETTGLDPKKDEVVQIAGVRIVNGRLMRSESFDMLVDPERPIPLTSTNVHGISEEMVKGAPTIAEAGRRFHAYCRDAVLIAHNAPFDIAFLRRHEAAIGARFDQPVLDTVLLSAVAFGRSAGHSLDALADRLGIVIPPEVRHTALGDSIATAEAFLKLVPILKQDGVVTLADAFDAMRQHRALLETVS